MKRAGILFAILLLPMPFTANADECPLPAPVKMNDKQVLALQLISEQTVTLSMAA